MDGTCHANEATMDVRKNFDRIADPEPNMESPRGHKLSLPDLSVPNKRYARCAQLNKKSGTDTKQQTQGRTASQSKPHFTVQQYTSVRQTRWAPVVSGKATHKMRILRSVPVPAGASLCAADLQGSTMWTPCLWNRSPIRYHKLAHELDRCSCLP